VVVGPARKVLKSIFALLHGAWTMIDPCGSCVGRLLGNEGRL
jgi:hypothetical protein